MSTIAAAGIPRRFASLIASWPDRVGPWQQIVESALRVALDDAGDDLSEVGVWLDADELAGLDQRGDHRPMLAALAS